MPPAEQDRASRAAQHREEDPGLVWDVPLALGVPQAGPFCAVVLGMPEDISACVVRVSILPTTAGCCAHDACQLTQSVALL